MSVYVPVCGNMHMDSDAIKAKGWYWWGLEIKVQVALSPQTWILGTALWSSTRTIWIPNCWAVSPAQEMTVKPFSFIFVQPSLMILKLNNKKLAISKLPQRIASIITCISVLPSCMYTCAPRVYSAHGGQRRQWILGVETQMAVVAKNVT